MPQERLSQPPQLSRETRMFRDAPMQSLADMLKTLPVPITITQHLDTEREKIFYRYQVGEPTPDNPVGIRMGATRHFLDAVRFSLEVEMKQGEKENSSEYRAVPGTEKRHAPGSASA